MELPVKQSCKQDSFIAKYHGVLNNYFVLYIDVCHGLSFGKYKIEIFIMESEIRVLIKSGRIFVGLTSK